MRRSVAAPRSTTSISLSRSRYWVTVAPDTELFRNCASSCEEMPSTRALFWSTVRRTTFEGSSQSNCTLNRSGIALASRRAPRRRSRAPSTMSSPDTRNCTGKPTGGPFSSRDTRPRTAGKSVSNSRISRPRTASRSTLFPVDQDELREVGLHELLVERQVEARAAGRRRSRRSSRCPAPSRAPPPSSSPPPASRGTSCPRAGAGRPSAPDATTRERTAAARSGTGRSTPAKAASVTAITNRRCATPSRPALRSHR